MEQDLNLSFLNWHDLKEQLKDQWYKVQEKIEDNPSFNQLKEIYDNLPSLYQRILLFGSIAFVLFLIVLLPLRSFISSLQYESKYNENKKMIQSLMEAQIEKSTGFLLPSSFDLFTEEKKIKKSLNRFAIFKEQKSQFTSFEVPKALKPSPLSAEGIDIHLKNLNLTEVVQIGHKLQNATPYIQLIGLEMKESLEHPFYFDVNYKLSSFYMKKSEKEKSNRKKNRKKSL